MKRRKINWQRGVLRWVATVVPFLLLLVFQQQIGISPAVWIVFIVMYLYVEARTDFIEERAGIQNIRSINHDLDYDLPIDPKEVVSLPVADDAWGVTQESLQFAQHFAAFGRIMNDWLDRTAWRIQQDAETEISELGDGGPIYGYRYTIYLGQVKVGRLSLMDGFDYSLKNPEVIARVTIWDARSYAFSTLTEFLDGIVAHVGGSTKDERAGSYQAVRNAMLETVWQIGPYSIVSANDLEIRISGTAVWYLQKAGFLARERTALDDMFAQTENWPKT